MKVVAGREARWKQLTNGQKDIPDGEKIIRIAETWANLMEADMATGQTLEACAKETFLLATKGEEGIDDNIRLAIELILATVWSYGEQFRQLTDAKKPARGRKK